MEAELKAGEHRCSLASTRSLRDNSQLQLILPLDKALFLSTFKHTGNTKDFDI